MSTPRHGGLMGPLRVSGKLKRAARDLALTRRARRAGAKHALKIIQEARRAGVPVSWAFALVDQESAFNNIFGGDHGNLANDFKAPFFRVKVTAKRVRALLAWIARGLAGNGVGLTQLTWPPLVKEANKRGGAHKPRVQLRVGFEFFKEVTGGDYEHDAWKYNGHPRYQAEIASKRRRWHTRLT